MEKFLSLLPEPSTLTKTPFEYYIYINNIITQCYNIIINMQNAPKPLMVINTKGKIEYLKTDSHLLLQYFEDIHCILDDLFTLHNQS